MDAVVVGSQRQRPRPEFLVGVAKVAGRPARCRQRIEALVHAQMFRRARAALRSIRAERDSLGPSELERLVTAAQKADDARSLEAFQRARHTRFPNEPAAVDRLAARFPSATVALLAKHGLSGGDSS